MADIASVVSLLSRFENTFDHPETYLKPPRSLEKDNITAVKEIFDFCKKDEPNGSRSLVSTCPLSELLVDDFDIEQIWQEIELQNTPLLHLGKTDVKSVTQNVKKLSLFATRRSEVEGNRSNNTPDNSDGTINGRKNSNKLLNHTPGSESESGSIDKELSHDEESDIETYGNDDGDDDGSGNDDDGSDDNNGDEDGGDEGRLDKRKRNLASKDNRKQKHSAKKSQVDDAFFKLSDMIQFLDKEDRRFEREHKKKSQKENDIDDGDGDDSCESDGELIDYFVDIDNDNADATEEEEDWIKALGATETLLGRKSEVTKKRKRKSPRQVKYADFFDPPDGEQTGYKEGESEIEDEDDDEDDESGGDEEMATAEDDDGEDDQPVSNARESEMDSDEEKTVSSFEKKQQKLKQRIEKLENANLAPKTWQMSGEAGGKVRPINSLLEEDVTFDHTTTAAPDITEETTQNLEDIVKQRIKDEAWDDVQRKVKPVTEPFEYKKKLPLDQEKSKLSLSQIYEQEYLKQTQVEAEDKQNEEHEEIKRIMAKLFVKLDALSNFHFTPKPPKPELKVVSNVPVISVEEVAPVSVSDAMMLAPEEVHEKKKEQKGTTEQTDTDRKRERRAKKRRQHERAVEKQKRRKLVEKLNPGLGNKYSKKAALKRMEKDSKTSKNVSLLKDEGSGKDVKSSSAFFSRLQDEVKDQVRAKKESRKKKEKATAKVSQLKL